MIFSEESFIEFCNKLTLNDLKLSIEENKEFLNGIEYNPDSSDCEMCITKFKQFINDVEDYLNE